VRRELARSTLVPLYQQTADTRKRDCPAQFRPDGTFPATGQLHDAASSGSTLLDVTSTVPKAAPRENACAELTSAPMRDTFRSPTAQDATRAVAPVRLTMPLELMLFRATAHSRRPFPLAFLSVCQAQLLLPFLRHSASLHSHLHSLRPRWHMAACHLSAPDGCCPKSFACHFHLRLRVRCVDVALEISRCVCGPQRT
jgi:hypothetical protein